MMPMEKDAYIHIKHKNIIQAIKILIFIIASFILIIIPIFLPLGFSPNILNYYATINLPVSQYLNPAGIKLKLIEALKYKKKVVARPEALLGAGLEDIVPNATEPEEFAQKCIDALENKIDYDAIWKKFDDMYDNEKIFERFKQLALGMN